MELGDGAGEDPLVGLGSGGQSRTAQSAHQGGGRPLLLHVGAGPLLPARRRVCDPSHTCTQYITVLWRRRKIREDSREKSANPHSGIFAGLYDKEVTNYIVLRKSLV